MAKLGVPQQMLDVIIALHKDMKAFVLSNGDQTEPFNVTNGTKQGCVLALALFALFFSVMLEHAFLDVDEGIPVEYRTSGGIFN